jgi:hypothetical protein
MWVDDEYARGFVDNILTGIHLFSFVSFVELLPFLKVLDQKLL